MFEPGINKFMPFMLGVAPGRLCRGALGMGFLKYRNLLIEFINLLIINLLIINLRITQPCVLRNLVQKYFKPERLRAAAYKFDMAIWAFCANILDHIRMFLSIIKT